MPQCELATKPLIQCLRRKPRSTLSLQSPRLFASSAYQQDEIQLQKPSSETPDPSLVSSLRLAKEPVRSGTPLIGSRRRRMALQQSANIPFEQLPYQCFQEARKILQADRKEKLKQIEIERAKIARLKAADLGNFTEQQRQNKLLPMQKHLEKLKIWADFNDPVVKRNFEDGKGDMNKPIYRFLADRKWREYRRPVLVQRITQMHVIPDVLAHIDPTADVRLYFGRRNIPPGDFVQSTISEKEPRLNVQLFEKGEKLVTVAVIDSDVPNLVNDGFDYRCHFLAANIPLSPTSPFIDLANLAKDTQIILPWKAPYAQKGSPYHRLSTFIFEQPYGEIPNVSELQEKTKHEKFILRSFAGRHGIRPIGAHLFRTQWDEGMGKVMKRARVEGADIQLKRAKIEPLPYKRRNPSSMR